MNSQIDHFSLLKSIPRDKHRKMIELNYIHLPFIGKDIWTLYELSWLNRNGLPQIAIARVEVNVTSKNIFESKSLKIYINSFHQIKFDHHTTLVKTLELDLIKCVCGEVSIKLFNLNEIKNQKISEFYGMCIDNQDIQVTSYKYNPLLLINSSNNEIVEESLYSHLLKSNCPITKQPDWASIQIIYSGQKINHAALLFYLISFRSCNEFHEECIERIFNDIENICKPKKLSVYARYTRRGGIDINPWRSNTPFSPCLIRMARQ
ncbi:NADPH-dependent 7-cyano-7-deazaguanine reductase QueF [Buchnera aphidicola (Brachycaudus cardui)]|uniref:NADPH-dependent 7-cyano-7-deazaguanine reductase n=1 Tax=Buchnera aphidicola (Brachycaudus cardui) TaxID=557993 RepID=A0A4D6Y1G7_9GAMM|nr:NADPH-dependent 7-cyano-7-deazaguanine reductase QueF [Buchnera aphidicola]QCI20434.1 NADPH-dependent 7-cyano-7-deazaguanine reductase QueF [Buchnera aphidicola (Brachycaudus cardui)]